MQLTKEQLQEHENNIFYYKLIIQGKTSNPELINIVFNYFQKYPELFKTDTLEDEYPDHLVEPILPATPDPAHVVFIRLYRKPKKTPPKHNLTPRLPYPDRRKIKWGPFEDGTLDEVPYDLDPYDD